GVDADTGEIIAAELSSKDVDDGSQVGPLLEQIAGPVALFTGDGAYDRDDVYREVCQRHPDAAVIVPPRSGAVPSATAKTAPTKRDRHLQLIAERGRMGWQRVSGYNWRALVEADIGRYKRVILRPPAFLRRAGADQIADDDEAGGDADPHVQRLLCGEPADRLDDREPGAGRALGIVLMRLGIAEIDQHAVAHIFGDKTVKAGDGVGDAAVVGADDLAQILGIEARRQRRRTDQIAEHHRQLPPLCVDCRR